MYWLSAPARRTVAVAAARIVALLLVCGLAECAAGGYCMSDANTFVTLLVSGDIAQLYVHYIIFFHEFHFF